MPRGTCRDDVAVHRGALVKVASPVRKAMSSMKRRKGHWDLNYQKLFEALIAAFQLLQVLVTEETGRCEGQSISVLPSRIVLVHCFGPDDMLNQLFNTLEARQALCAALRHGLQLERERFEVDKLLGQLQSGNFCSGLASKVEHYASVRGGNLSRDVKFAKAMMTLSRDVLSADLTWLALSQLEEASLSKS
eukprot:TRINITY_DN16260_c0_g1_i1.p1 TRINITY_DN16260_c0_g1~~TRINITY_DN16260_c0_g1_i1.p1  ORF type:complete len:191 (+),score=37.62 TRINITY_DN16260_c0_g1_i1:77-649(+)